MSANQASTNTNQTECINPATGEIIGYSPEHTVADLLGAAAAARQAQIHWAALDVRDRVKALGGIKPWLVDRADTLAAVISKDNGKTRTEALATEVLPAVMALSYYLGNAARFLNPEPIPPSSLLLANKWSKLVRVPYGVVAIISPWNYPFSIPFAEVIMALLAGNAVILKTATQTQMVGRALETCFQEANLPAGLFTFVNLPGKVAGDALLDAGVDKLFFTGSVAVGRHLMAQAAKTLTPVVLELGGNDPMLVCDDADLDRASYGALWAAFQNCGQSCGGVERIYVHRAVYEPFLERLCSKVKGLRVGLPAGPQTDMGAMTTRQQTETVRRHLEDAISKGAIVAAQSPVPEGMEGGNFLPAMVLTQVDHGMLVMTEETFGPVVGVMPVGDMDEAVVLANDSPYGLTGSVWSRDVATAEQIGRRIRAGVITINDHLMSHGLAETPWGGFKTSGMGRTHGKIGFHEMTQPQVVVHDLLSFAKRNLWWHPYSEALYRGLRGALHLFYGTRWRDRLAGLFPLARVLTRIFRA
ncbi:MAG TPA: aldehyde dehydrogenase [Syntrophobacteraceae bacterium]|nr:aldehyde dehydrogenase [Syntrophobacteraceae bacterium]